MAYIKTDDSNYYAIADAIRSKTGGTTAYKPSEFPNGIEEVFTAGEQAEYDRFWNGYQKSGTRSGYSYAFYGETWNDNTFRPKYDIKVTGSSESIFNSSYITDLVGLLTTHGVKLDYSECTFALSNTFAYSKITHVPEMNVEKSPRLLQVFDAARAVVTIDKLIVSETTLFSNTFRNTIALENLIVEGTIGQNGFNVQWSTLLSRDSIASIINALSDTASGLTVTLSQTAVDNAFTEEEWEALLATKTNWTLTLA